MKILAKTNGPTLVCASGDFLDAYKFRLTEYDTQVRGWNNRNLLEIKGFIEDSVSAKDLEILGEEEFIKKYINKKEEPKEEVKVEEPKEEVKVEEPEEVKVEEPEEVKVENFIQKKKKKIRKN